MSALAENERQALERLLAIAAGVTGQSRRVADFLLAWWNAGSCGAFDFTSLWSLDDRITDDCILVFRFIARNRHYPDALGYEIEFLRVIDQWRPELARAQS